MDKEDDFRQFESFFWQLSRKMEYMWKRVYAQTFPGSQSYIMYLLQQHGPKKMTELADALHLTAGAVTTASNQLIEQGYIDRLRNEQDRRVVYLELTEKGNQILSALQQEGRNIMKKVFDDTSEKEVEMMTVIFEQAIINIDQV